jgi:hypothetical protein
LCHQKPGFWYTERNHAQRNIESSEACFFFHAASRVDYVEHIHGDEALARWAPGRTESNDDGDTCYETATTDIDRCIAAIFLVS